jgi:hypothetical protein
MCHTPQLLQTFSAPHFQQLRHPLGITDRHNGLG